MEVKSDKLEERAQWISPESSVQRIWDVKSDGDPPIWKFNDLRLPEPILRTLTATGILPLTPLHCQGLRVALSGRDTVGISFTGPGKTLVVVLPLIVAALRGKDNGVGPYSFAVFPSAETAVQAFGILEQFLVTLKEFGGYPDLNPLLCVEENDVDSGKVHADIIVTTPRRLKFMLDNKIIMNVENCRYLALDETPLADGMEEILDHFKATKRMRQTVVLCERVTPLIKKFFRNTLRNHSSVDAGKFGAPWLNVTQKVKYVNKQAEKLPYILECLKISPALIFCKVGQELDHIYEGLVSQGIGATAVHGFMDKQQREEAILSFKSRKTHAMLATETALEELSEIRELHQVINYEMPSNIESYFRRIALVGRILGPRGRATTFIDKTQNVTALLDLKHFLEVTNQDIPPEFAHFVAMVPDSQSNKRIRMI